MSIAKLIRILLVDSSSLFYSVYRFRFFLTQNWHIQMG
jgi:hypothetical protein